MQAIARGPGRIPRSEACAAQVLETSLRVTRLVRWRIRRARPADLSFTQFRGLAFANAYPGSSLSDASEHLGLTLAATSRVMSKLGRRGLVRRRIAPRDRRRSMFEITRRGRAQLDGAFAAARSYLAEVLVPLSARERDSVTRALRRIEPLVTPQLRHPGGRDAS